MEKYQILLIAGLFCLSGLICAPDDPTLDRNTSEITLNKNGNRESTTSTLMGVVTRVISDMQTLFYEDTIPDPSIFENSIDSLGRDLRKRYVECISSSVLVDTLIRIVYRKWNILFDPDQDDLRSLLPHTVITGKKGSCLGVSLLFLLLAEKLDYPLYGVLLPGHFFTRYDDGNEYRNIEPNRQGYTHPIQYYRMRYGIEENSWYTLKNLSQKETAAVLYYNCANICAQRGKHDAARRYLKLCITGLDGFAEAWGNLGIEYAAIGNNDSARSAFYRAFSLNPKLPGLLQNIGAFELGQNCYKEAKKAYRNGLTHSPGDPDLLYGMAFTCFSLAALDSAHLYLSQIGIPTDSSTREYKLAQLIDEKQDLLKK